jgi:hypothetical protein
MITLERMTQIVTQRANRRATERSAKEDLEYFVLWTLEFGLFDYFRHNDSEREPANY